MNKVIFYILFFYSSWIKGQIRYKDFSFELIKQASINHIFDNKSRTLFEKELEILSEDSAKTFFLKKSKLIFREIKYGHKLNHLQFESLKEEINETGIDSLIESITNPNQIKKVFQNLEPKHPEYHFFKKAITTDSLYNILKDNLNFYRYLNRFNFIKYIVVNIPNAKLKTYNQDQKVLEMNIIVGQKDKQTPRMTTNLDAIVVYPYWIPTRSIAINEILPKVKKNINYLEKNNFDVLDNKKNVVGPDTLKWASFSAKNFPYQFRQGTGCDNSLGLLKFNISNPFSVYMHDTAHNKRSMLLFENENRFFSHGCIRLSMPVELANWAFEKPLITEEFMNTCLKDPKSTTIKLNNKIPLFVIYNTSEIDANGDIVTYKDVYGLK